MQDSESLARQERIIKRTSEIMESTGLPQRRASRLAIRENATPAKYNFNHVKIPGTGTNHRPRPGARNSRHLRVVTRWEKDDYGRDVPRRFLVGA